MKKYYYRSAITGKFVSKEYAEANPDITIRHERVEKRIGTGLPENCE